MAERKLSLISFNKDVTPTRGQIIFTGEIPVIGRAVSAKEKKSTFPSTKPYTGSSIFLGMYEARIGRRAGIVNKETRTQPTSRESYAKLDQPAAWAGNYATWERRGPNWSRPAEKITPQLNQTSYQAHNYESWEKMVRERILHD